MKLVWKFGIGVFVSAGIGLVLVVYLSLNAFIGSAINYIGPQATKTEFYMGSIRINPLSGSGAIYDLNIGNPKNFDTPNALKVDSIKIQMEPMTLFSDAIHIQKIVIFKPEITWEGGLSDNNLEQIQNNIEVFSKQIKSENQESPSQPTKLIIDDIQIQEAVAHIRLKRREGKTVAVLLPLIQLKNLGRDSQGLDSSEVAKKMMTSIMEKMRLAVAQPKTLIQSTGKAVRGVANTIDGLLE